MTNQIEYLNTAVRNKRSELARSIKAQRAQLNVSEVEHDVLDRMQSMTSRDEAVSFLDALTRTLSDVDAALEAMKDSSYGICAECGTAIAPRRLEAIPWASRCIRCQEALDHDTRMRFMAPRWDEAA